MHQQGEFFQPFKSKQQTLESPFRSSSFGNGNNFGATTAGHERKTGLSSDATRARGRMAGLLERPGLNGLTTTSYELHA